MTNTPAEVSPTIDLEVLERLAAEATPGPYEIEATTISVYIGPQTKTLGSWVANISIPYGEWHKPHREQREVKQAEFFAAADPQVVAALVAAVKAARVVAAAWEWEPGVAKPIDDLLAALHPFSHINGEQP